MHGSEVAALARTILRTAWGAPIVAQARGRRIIGGHGRLEAAKLILRGIEVDGEMRGGAEHSFGGPPGCVPVRIVDVSDAEADAMTLADNARALQGTDSGEMILAMAAGFGRESTLLADMGLDGAALDALVKSAGDVALESGAPPDASERHEIVGGIDGEDPGAEEPPPDAPVFSRAGEVYELGPHRLVCGDSREAATWDALLGGEKAQCVWTDPPYGVAVNDVADAAEARKLHRRTDGLKVENDSLTPEQTEALFGAASRALVARSVNGAAWYVAAPPGPLHLRFGRVLDDLGIWHQTLAWVKQVFAFGRSDYHYRHEPIFYGWTPGAAHYFVDDRTQDSVLEFDRPHKSPEHPTMKPVALVQRCVENSSKPGWIVCDPFGGSGTTLIACAQSGRVARLIELAPRYCDVIRRRWTKFAVSAGIDPGAGALASDLALQ